VQRIDLLAPPRSQEDAAIRVYGLRRITLKIRSAILTALSAAMLSTPGLAQQATARISYADLDLSTQQGQDQLARRIDSAARAKCGIADIRTGTLLQDSKAKQCLRDAKESAHQQVAEQISRQNQRGG
jgi:UrcA family protein